MTQFADDDRPYPKVIKCRGGWFAVEQKGDLGSGPWNNEEAAKLALEGDYSGAHWANKETERGNSSI